VVRNPPPWAARRHAPFLGNGGKARRDVIGETLPVQPALSGPLGEPVSAAIPPPAALFENQGFAYLSASSVYAFELGHSIPLPGLSCQGFRGISTKLTKGEGKGKGLSVRLTGAAALKLWLP